MDMHTKHDDLMMRRALRLAALGRHASPNPMVGCVLVSAEGVKIGEGYHPKAGEPHAEIFALRAAPPAKVHGATAYVTLEPCSHFGRTPPCADALIQAGVARVVIAIADLDTRVGGRGIARMQDAGIDVAVGLRADEARALNAAYLKHRTTGRPWVVYKSAMTLDGKIATWSGDSKWISSAISRRASHRQLRDRCDAILVGVGTVVADDPQLTARGERQNYRDPLRVIVDSRCRLPLESQVVRQSAVDGKTLVATTEAADDKDRARLAEAGCQLLVCASDAQGRVDLSDLMTRLGTRGDILGVLVEGGAELAASLASHRLIDRWIAYVAPKIVGGRVSPGPFGGPGVEQMGAAFTMSSWTVRRSGPDIVIDARIG